jgi:cation diffusion facilitator CzcD-associated flavoprotein CzcO
MARTDLPRIAILGAGPIGLEAALNAATLKLPFVVYERGRLAEHLHQWGHVRLFSPFGMNSTRLGRERIQAEQPHRELPNEDALLTGREHFAAYLEPLAKSPLLKEHIRLGVAVRHVSRRGLFKSDAPGDVRRGTHPFRLLLREGDKERFEEADVVLDCTGTYSVPRWLGDGGIPALGEDKVFGQIAHGLEDVLGARRENYADRTILVVGAGYSAATTVCRLAELAEKHGGTWVIWLARGPKSQPIRRFVNDPLRERDQVAVRANTLATRGDGNVEFHPQAAIDAVESQGNDGFTVRGRCGDSPATWRVDRIIANVGYSPDPSLYRELQIHECYASLGPMALAATLLKHTSGDCLTIPAAGAAALRSPEPNFFILGAKSYGRNSNFLLRTGFEQVRDAFASIVGGDLVGRFPALRSCPKS